LAGRGFARRNDYNQKHDRNTLLYAISNCYEYDDVSSSVQAGFSFGERATDFLRSALYDIYAYRRFEEEI